MKKTIFILLAICLVWPIPASANSESITADNNPGHYHATWHSQSDWPIMQTQEITTAWIKFTNTGTATWYKNSDLPVHLGTSHALDRDSSFYKHTWLSNNRPAQLKEDQVAPGEIGTFEFYLKAPDSPGTYQEYFQPLIEGLTWMEDWGVYLQITVEESDTTKNTDLNDNQSGYHALWLSQSSEDVTLAPGETTQLWVKFTNTGDTTWHNSGTNPIHLGTDNPTDRTSKFYQTSWLSNNRAANMTESSVAPNQSGKFIFTIKAPTSTGTYREYFTPVAEGLTWIGNKGVFWDITVTNSSDNDNSPTDSDFTLSGSYTSGQVKLSWTPYELPLQTSSVDDTIDGYKVVRSQISTSPVYPDDWWVYVTGQNNTTYNDSSVSNGNTYYYRVGAYRSSTGVIEYSNYIKIVIPADQNTTSSIKLSSTTLTNGLQLDWDIYNNADGYKLLRSSSDSNLTYPEDGYYKYISTSSSHSYVDTDIHNGDHYYYRIGAYKDGSIVMYSNTINVTYQSNEATLDDFSLTANNINSGIQLIWGQYIGQNISGYKILRSATDSNLTYPEDGYYKYISNSASTGYVDDDVISGKSYYYRVAAYNGSAVAYTNTVEITAN